MSCVFGVSGWWQWNPCRQTGTQSGRNLRDKVSGPLLQDERFYRQGGCDSGCGGSLSGGPYWSWSHSCEPTGGANCTSAPLPGVPRIFKLKVSCLPMTHRNPLLLNLAAPFSSLVCVSLHSRFLTSWWRPAAIALSLAVMFLFFLHTLTVHFWTSALEPWPSAAPGNVPSLLLSAVTVFGVACARDTGSPEPLPLPAFHAMPRLCCFSLQCGWLRTLTRVEVTALLVIKPLSSPFRHISTLTFLHCRPCWHWAKMGLQSLNNRNPVQHVCWQIDGLRPESEVSRVIININRLRL